MLKAPARGRSTWLIDTGATCSCTGFRSLLTNIVKRPAKIASCGTAIVVSQEEGMATIDTPNNQPFRVTHVKYHPSFRNNILAIAPFMKKGCSIKITAQRCICVTATGVTVFVAKSDDAGLFWLDTGSTPPDSNSKLQITRNVTDIQREVQNCNATRSYHDNNISDLMMWHRRLAHRNFADCAKLLDLPAPRKTPFCEPCVVAKSQRHAFGGAPTNRPVAPRPGYLLHSDINGPLRVALGSGKNKYIAVWVDDYSRMLFTAFLPTKDAWQAETEALVYRIEAHLGRQRVVAQIRTDSAWYAERSTRFATFCSSRGIVPVYSAPHTQQYERSSGYDHPVQLASALRRLRDRVCALRRQQSAEGVHRTGIPDSN